MSVRILFLLSMLQKMWHRIFFQIIPEKMPYTTYFKAKKIFASKNSTFEGIMINEKGKYVNVHPLVLII